MKRPLLTGREQGPPHDRGPFSGARRRPYDDTCRAGGPSGDDQAWTDTHCVQVRSLPFTMHPRSLYLFPSGRLPETTFW